MDTYELMNNLYHSDQSLIVKARSRKDNLIYILKIFTSNKINGFPHHSIIIAIREIKMLQEMQGDFVVLMKDSFEIPRAVVLVMEYCDSKSLRSFIKEHMGSPIQERVICSLLLQMMYVLLIMNNRNIIHHAFTPDNILITRKSKGEQIRLTDFGVGTNGEKFVIVYDVKIKNNSSMIQSTNPLSI